MLRDKMTKSITITSITITPPKTIVRWSDKTRTEVNCETDPFDEEKGVLLCICKKFLGSYSVGFFLFHLVLLLKTNC